MIPFITERRLSRSAMLFVACSFIFVSLVSAMPAKLIPGINGELMIKEEYKVNQGETLLISVHDADVTIETHSGNEAIIEVFLDGKNMSKAKAYFEDQNFEVTREGSRIIVDTDPRRKNYNWNQIGGARITVLVLIPEDFNVEVKTADGDVFVDDILGETSISTSDGDIATGELSGPRISIRTSDGDIQAENMDAPEVSIQTSDGDISLDNVEADELSVRTSDGDIKAKYLAGVTKISTSDGDIAIRSLEGGDISVRTSDGEIYVDEVNSNSAEFVTSDGNIRLSGVSGDISAKTSDGDVEVSLADASDIMLRAGDGDIYIKAPLDYSASLSLKGERVEVSRRFDFDGTIKKNHASGEINGGRYSLEARSSGGRVVLDRN